MVAGRTSVTPRALERVARGVAAEHLGVDGSRVAVRLSDAGGALAVAVSAPLRTAPWGTDAPGLVTRSEQARANIARDITALSGSQVGSVALRVTGVEIVEARRVL
ncbi:hypothetical protein BH11ACT5_BH11ACT5_10460 [soil metagenome]